MRLGKYKTMIELLNTDGGRVFGLVGGKHSGKTTALLQLIEESKQFETDKYCYFYHQEYKDKVKGVEFINTLNDLEQIKDAFIFIDEFSELFQINDRHATEMIKSVIAQIEHNNCILVMCGLPEYYNKLLSGFVGDNWLLKSLNYDELVNGSGLKKYIKYLSGDFVGGTRLNIDITKLLVNGVFHEVDYNKSKDKKAGRVNLFKKSK